MSLSIRLTRFLDQRKVPYRVDIHAPAYTAHEIALEEHVPDQAVLKAVMVNADGRHVMLVIPGSCVVDMFKAQEALMCESLELDREEQFKMLFPDSETGAMPPFGFLYGVPCYVDAKIVRSRSVIFNAGSHRESIVMDTMDFLKLENALVADLSVSKKVEAA